MSTPRTKETTSPVHWVAGPFNAEYAQAWAVSFVLHGLIIALALTFLSDLKLVPQPEPFTWNVVMVEADRATPTTEESVVQAQPVPEQPKAVEKRPSPTQPQVQREPPVQEVVQQKTTEVPRPVQAIPPASKDVAVAHEEPVADESAAAVEAAPSADPPPREPAFAQREVISEPSVPPEASAVQQETQAPETQVARSQELPVQGRPAARRDYGWLAEALWSRVERLKRYPHLARLNRWEGKVVLRAVIRDDGQVLDVQVSQSSGYAILDQDGMEVLRLASPLPLAQPLGQAQVVIQVPISYRLER